MQLPSIVFVVEGLILEFNTGPRWLSTMSCGWVRADAGSRSAQAGRLSSSGRLTCEDDAHEDSIASSEGGFVAPECGLALGTGDNAGKSVNLEPTAFTAVDRLIV
jgi:hypothetical protein